MAQTSDHYILINERRLYLEEDALSVNDLVGFNGDSEQCQGCGQDIQECAGISLAVEGAVVICDQCGEHYPIQILE